MCCQAEKWVTMLTKSNQLTFSNGSGICLQHEIAEDAIKCQTLTV